MRFACFISASLFPLVLAAFQIDSLQNHALGERFNACLTALSEEAKDHRGIRPLVHDLEKTQRYRYSEWNINHSYNPSAINLLIPMPTLDQWPAICGIPADPADCISVPKEAYIICNPAMGKRFASPLIHSGIANPETYLAARFLVLTFLGHELGHLAQSGDQTIRHLKIPAVVYGMKCNSAPADSVEERADAFGIALACEALRGAPEAESIKEPKDVIDTLARLQNSLDEDYFTMDDACISIEHHPSISRRKHTFASAYVDCFFPDNPVQDVAKTYAQTFQRFEDWLRARQDNGQLASGSYGKGSLYSHRVIAGERPNEYLTFDSTGTDSALWYVRPGAGGTLDIEALMRWRRTGRALSAFSAGHSGRLSILLDEGGGATSRSLVEVLLNCINSHCGTIVHSQNLPLGTAVSQGLDGSLVVHGAGHYEAYTSIDDFFARKPIRRSVVAGMPADPDSVTVAISRDRSVFIPRSEPGLSMKVGGAFKTVKVISRRRSFSRVLFPLSSEVHVSIEAAAFSQRRFLFTVYENPLFGNGRLRLWDCPNKLLDYSANVVTLPCRVYLAPSETDDFVALVTHDFSTMFNYSIEAPPEECGRWLIIRERGWVWLLDRQSRKQDLLAADGVIGCKDADQSVTTFRARRADVLNLEPRDAEVLDTPLSSIPTLK